MPAFPSSLARRLDGWLRRSPAVLVSAAVHLVVLLILAAIVYREVGHERIAFLQTRAERPVRIHDDRLPRAMVERPPTERPTELEHPAAHLADPVPVTRKTPRGASLEQLADRRTVAHADNADAALGMSAGGADAFGRPDGDGDPGRGAPSGAVRAVDAALLWLADHQGEGGAWDTDGYAGRCGQAGHAGRLRAGRCGGPGGVDDAGGGFAEYDVGVSSLATLAFLGRGHTERAGRFRDTVRRAIAYLRQHQARGGPLHGAVGYDPARPETVYNHALATLALCEAYAVTRHPLLRRPATDAVRFCLQAQNVPGDEPDPARQAERAMGWKYGIRPGKSDTSVTGWMVLALKAAVVAGIDVPEIAFIGARNWLQRCTAPDGRVGYVSNNPPRSSVLEAQRDRYGEVPCMTAVAAICRVFTGTRNTDPVVRRSRDVLLREEHLPRFEPADFRPGATYAAARRSPVNAYYWYYATYAVFHTTRPGSPQWTRWDEAMRKAILPYQHWGQDACGHDGGLHCLDGSWDPVGAWGLAGGRVYATALNALTLETYYRYVRAE